MKTFDHYTGYSRAAARCVVNAQKTNYIRMAYAATQLAFPEKVVPQFLKLLSAESISTMYVFNNDR